MSKTGNSAINDLRHKAKMLNDWIDEEIQELAKYEGEINKAEGKLAHIRESRDRTKLKVDTYSHQLEEYLAALEKLGDGAFRTEITK